MSRAPLTIAAEEFLKALGAALREVRREAGLHQEHVAARSGTSGPRIGEIERGEIATSVARVFETARAIGVPMSALFRRVELATTEGAVEALRAELREAIGRMTATDLDLIAVIAKRLMRRE